MNRTLKESLRNHAAEFDRLQSRKTKYENSGALNDYLSAIDEMETLLANGETVDEAFSGTFASNKELCEFLKRAIRKFGHL